MSTTDEQPEDFRTAPSSAVEDAMRALGIVVRRGDDTRPAHRTVGEAADPAVYRARALDTDGR